MHIVFDYLHYPSQLFELCFECTRNSQFWHRGICELRFQIVGIVDDNENCDLRVIIVQREVKSASVVQICHQRHSKLVF